MKSINANKLLFFLGVLVWVSCNYRSETDLISGNWNYTKISVNDSAICETTEEDFMKLSEDGVFEYQIAALDKHLYGRWTYDNHTLHLKYETPGTDTTRHFEVDILSAYALKMHEGEMVFDFRKL